MNINFNIELVLGDPKHDLRACPNKILVVASYEYQYTEKYEPELSGTSQSRYIVRVLQ